MINNENNIGVAKTVINWYPGHMAKTKRLVKEQLDLIDIVYEVVDSRMPYSSKIKDLDDVVKNKPRILIFTKYDLCDKKETDKWVKFYEKIGYKVITMDLTNNPNLKPIFKLTEEIMSDINQKRESKGLLKRRTRALIIGIPNVGKSTLLNRLVGKKAVEVGNKPGVTKQLNWIRINSEIELLDTPGILWPKLDEQTVAFNLASLTAIKEEILPLYDVCEYIINTLYEYYPNELEKRYGIDYIDDDFVTTLERIGKKRGCLIKGGEIDYDKVINIILNDIKSGTIKNITFDRCNNE
ncbi:MAG: ribosome biogenesis GTPase YlqF [Firmicutes bacterium]|nr:ribosome biogenesis GTPase YlqF [Bacillota bacterium]